MTEAQPGRRPLVVYDADRMVEILMARDRMNRHEAEEFLSFNTFGAWLGEGTPIFVRRTPVGVKVQDWLAEQFEGE